MTQLSKSTFFDQVQLEQCVIYGHAEADSFGATTKAVSISMLLLNFELSANKPLHRL
jgi:hypothetical protein